MARVEISVMAFVLLLMVIMTAAVAAPGTYSVAAFRLYTDFHRQPPPLISEAMQKEIELIMSPIGWRLEWDSLGNVMAGDSSVSLAVVTFKGDCDVVDLMVKGPPPAVLAMTSVSEGQVLPYSYVNCNAIRTFLAPMLVRLALPSREATFGRALGRVVAHELYHVLTNERLHGRDGIGAAQFTAEKLTSADLRFGHKEVERLRTRLFPVVRSYEALSGSSRGSGTSIYVTSGCSGCHGWRGEGTQWGPPLLKESKAYDPAALAALLTDTASKMYRRAKDLNVLWPRLERAQVEELSAYLRSRHN